MTTTLTGRNQITVPAALASKLGLKPGSRIEWLPGDSQDEFRCRVLPDPARLSQELLGAGRKYLRAGKKHPLIQLVEERAAEDEERSKELR